MITLIFILSLALASLALLLMALTLKVELPMFKTKIVVEKPIYTIPYKKLPRPLDIGSFDGRSSRKYDQIDKLTIDPYKPTILIDYNNNINSKPYDQY